MPMKPTKCSIEVGGRADPVSGCTNACQVYNGKGGNGRTSMGLGERTVKKVALWQVPPLFLWLLLH